ncbi:hypothetical protein Rsub_12299 [Raphidocelis subcapitata]|uniref:Uncharacterized protein n=1 Tax=Raphidocelis subcapitata TaxID=307507 RepID=A0A2V0PNS8_9CHLO|nr:hypothetical protein Rsub_12299 [Raphidocelis subcapitata]|eukprot:GBF99620.1 hypothetical protein Rsub_12299 [Raphidocelis subcapitata]
MSASNASAVAGGAPPATTGPAADGEEPWNPFDAAEDRDPFPDTIDAALMRGRGGLPQFDVDARARLAPAAIDAAAPAAATPVARRLPRETSLRLEAQCQAWFEDQSSAKAAEGDSPTPSCALALPGLPFGEVAGVDVPALSAAAGGAPPASQRGAAAASQHLDAAEASDVHGGAEGGGEGGVGTSSRPSRLDERSERERLGPSAADDAPPPAAAGAAAASPSLGPPRSRLSWLLQKNQQELRALLEEQQQRLEERQQWQEGGAEHLQQRDGDPGGPSNDCQALAKQQQAADPAARDEAPVRPDQAQCAAGQGACASAAVDGAQGECVLAPDDVPGAATASVAAAAAAPDAISGVLAALRQAGAMPRTWPSPLRQATTAAAAATQGSPGGSAGARRPRRRQRGERRDSGDEGRERPAARRWSRDVGASPDRQDAAVDARSPQPLRQALAPASTRQAQTQASGPWSPGGATGGLFGAPRASRLGRGAAAHAAAGPSGVHQAPPAGTAAEEVAAARDEPAGAGSPSPTSSDDSGDGEASSPCKGHDQCEEATSRAAARRVRMRFDPAARRGAGGVGDARRRAQTRAAATQTAVHEGTQTDGGMGWQPAQQQALHLLQQAAAAAAAGAEQTPIGQGVAVAVPGAPVQQPPAPFQQQQQQQATPAAAEQAAGGAGGAAAQQGGGGGGGAQLPPLQATPMLGGGAGHASGHVVRSLFMGPATPAPGAAAAGCRLDTAASTPLAPSAALGAAIGIATAAAALSAAAAAAAFMGASPAARTPPAPRGPAHGAPAPLPPAHLAATPAPTPGARTPAFGYAPAAGAPLNEAAPVPWPQPRRRSPDARHLSPMGAYARHGPSRAGAATPTAGAAPLAARTAPVALAPWHPDRTPAGGAASPAAARPAAAAAAAAAGSPAVWPPAPPRAAPPPERTPLRPLLEPQPPSVVAAAAALAAASGPAVIPPRLFPPSAKLAREAAAAAAGATPPPRRRQEQLPEGERECESGSQGRGQQREEGAPERDQRLRVEPPAASAGAQGACSSPLAPQASDGSKRQRRSSRAAGRPQSEMLRRFLAAPDD